MQKILLVEDSLEFQKIVSRTLAHHKVTVVASAEEASQKLYQENFDLVLLDITLPGKSGFSFLSELQADPKTREIPVFCISGKTEITDKTTAFTLGADDYLSKPFDPIELKARVDAKLNKNRRKEIVSSELKIGKLRIDKNLHRVFLNDRSGESSEIPLTQTEFKILCFLARRMGQVYTRDQLLIGVWGEDAGVLDRVVDVHVCSLRKKLKSLSGYIRAVPGVGYALSEEKINHDIHAEHCSV